MRSLELHAESKANLDGWVAFSCGKKESPFGYYFEVCGAVCPVYVRGNKKGNPNYQRADKSTQKTFTFTPQQHDEFVANWESQNDICMMCEGKGEFPTSWSKDKGAYNYKICNRCNGTGKPQARVELIK